MQPEVIAGLAAVLTAAGALAHKIGAAWLRGRRDDRRSMRDILSLGIDASKDARTQLETWLQESRESLQRCHERSAAMAKQIDELGQQVKMLKARCSQQQREIEELRSTLVQDYARRPDSLPPRQG